MGKQGLLGWLRAKGLDGWDWRRKEECVIKKVRKGGASGKEEEEYPGTDGKTV